MKFKCLFSSCCFFILSFIRIGSLNTVVMASDLLPTCPDFKDSALTLSDMFQDWGVVDESTGDKFCWYFVSYEATKQQLQENRFEAENYFERKILTGKKFRIQIKGSWIREKSRYCSYKIEILRKGKKNFSHESYKKFAINKMVIQSLPCKTKI